MFNPSTADSTEMAGVTAPSPNQRGAQKAQCDNDGPRLEFDTEQRHEGEDASFAVVIDAQGKRNIFDRCHDD